MVGFLFLSGFYKKKIKLAESVFESFFYFFKQNNCLSFGNPKKMVILLPLDYRDLTDFFHRRRKLCKTSCGSCSKIWALPAKLYKKAKSKKCI